MVRHRNLDPALVGEWMRDLAQNPPDESELELNPMNPREDPATALNVEPSGLPAWWPDNHPDLEQRTLTTSQRLTWFLNFLAGVLSPEQETLKSAEPSSRRQMIAQSLLRMSAELNSGELPIPDLS